MNLNRYSINTSKISNSNKKFIKLHNKGYPQNIGITLFLLSLNRLIIYKTKNKNDS
jgi:hypothetical protein